MDDARKERKQLFDEITRLQSEGHFQTITGIIKKYMDNGMYLDVEPLNGLKVPSRSASPVAKGRQSPTPRGRQSPVAKDRQSPTPKGRQSPVAKERQSPVTKSRQSPTSKERFSRSVDSAILQRSRSETSGATSPARKESEYSGNKSPRSRSVSSTRKYNDLNHSYQEPSQRTYQEPIRRSLEPSRLSFQEPMMTSSPVKSSFIGVNGMSVPVTPVVNDIISDDDDDDFEDEGIDGYQYNFEDISPSVSEFREIYPHRRTMSYRNNFSCSFDEGRVSPSMDDIEVNKILSRRPVRLDFNDTSDSYRGRSPRRDDNFNVSYDRSRSPGRLDVADLYEIKTPVRQQQYDFYGKNNIKRNLSRSQSPETRFNESRNYGDKSGEINNRLFLAALDNAVHDESQKKFYDDNDIPEKDSWHENNQRLTSSYGPESSHTPRPGSRSYSNSVRGILKNGKGDQNFPMKHGTSSSPLHRSVLARSVSPATRTSSNRDTNNVTSKLANSSIANKKTFGNSVKPLSASYSTKQASGFGTRPGSVASSGKSSFSGARSGKPLFLAASKSPGIVRNPKDLFGDVSLSPVRTSSPSKYQHTPL